MRSLRVQLLVRTALGITGVLLVSGAVLYALISRTLWAEFDESLAATARSLTALAEQEEEGLEFELTEVSLPEFEPSQHAAYYQVWLPDGTVFARSPSLLDADLELIAGTSENPAFQAVTFPDGRPGRIVGLAFVPRRESENGVANGPMTVTLVLGRDVLGLQATLIRVRGILIGVWLVAVVLSAGVLAGVVRRSLKPINRLSRQIADVGESELSARINADGMPRELAPVVDRLNELLARLESAFHRERRFTGDVAHELRTPLAGLRSKLELALSRDRAPEAYRKSVGDCLEINLQMQHMVENLLHLARADAGQLAVRREPVDLGALVQDCWQPLAEKAQARRLRVEWHLDSLGMIETDRDKLRLAIQNILDNAVTHVNAEGQVSISLSTENGGPVLTVSNTGSNLPRDDLHRVFDRFWRADPSHRDAEEAHCGLGLPLCQAVIEKLGGSIEARSAADGVFTVVIRLVRRSQESHRYRSAGRDSDH
jgi:two-component system sensor histidine kinase QseC